VRVQFWGTRGSIAKPGSSTARYGGNTSCIEVRTARDTLLVVDCGTGAHALGQKLMSAGPKGSRGHILISHTHWDHIQGIPFFAPLFVSGNEWEIYGPKGLGQSLREALAGQMQYTYFPITLDQFGATIRYHDLVEGSFEIDDIKISTHYPNHPALTLGYRMEADGVAVVYCCDHEPHSPILATGQGEITGQDQRYAAFIDGADLLIHDAQYTAEEYPAKVGWGHSPIEYAVKIGQHAGVKRIALTHHDPLRDDEALDRVLESVRARLRENGSRIEVFAAVEGQTVDVQASAAKFSEHPTGEFQAEMRIEQAFVRRSVLLGIVDPKIIMALSEAVQAEGIPISFASDGDTARMLTLKDRPSLVMLEHDIPRIDGMEICRAIRRDLVADDIELPIIMVAARQDQPAGVAAGVTDWLITPFTSSYARTKVRAWILRTACHWMKASVPEDEERRLASLRQLGILDTEPEERFDRITRLAAAVFDVPIALVSLVDKDRQWFKSCYGIGAKESSREASFCAHVVYSRETMLVSDTLQDPRFGDNPFVISEPRIRFYAGSPLILADGSCVGTLCLVDTRPRSLEGADVGLLQDLRDLVVHEMRQMGPIRPAQTAGDAKSDSLLPAAIVEAKRSES
jgi:phosphoribosyl 1,2-cyclic phosphodiesterase/CheY-like chemotaxis protein